jgi:hypothetical protein
MLLIWEVMGRIDCCFFLGGVGRVLFFYSSEIPYDTCKVEDDKIHVMTCVQPSPRCLVFLS